MTKRKTKKKTASQAKSGIPMFNFRKLNSAAKRKKKKQKRTLREQRERFLLADRVGLLSVYDVDRLLKSLHPGKFKIEWKLPFNLDKKDLYKLYRSNYSGSPPFNKTTVEKHYSDWVRYNYALAAKIALEEHSYSCLLRSPFFWKCLYIQNLLDQDSRRTYEGVKYDSLLYDDANKVYKVSDCVVTGMYRVEDSIAPPMPKWVALRMHFRPKFKQQVERITRKWAEKELNSTSLIKIEPLLIDMWKKQFEKGLANLQSQYARLKLGHTFYTL